MEESDCDEAPTVDELAEAVIEAYRTLGDVLRRVAESFDEVPEDLCADLPRY